MGSRQRFLGVFVLFSVLGPLIGAEVALASGHAPPPPPPPPVTAGTPPPPPPPVPEPRQLQIYVAVNGQTQGPFTQDQIKDKIASGEVNRQSMVWMEGMADWQTAATVQAVAPLLTAAPPAVQFDAAGFIVGTWETQGQVRLPDGTPAQTRSSMTYRPDGSLTGFGTMTVNDGYGPFTMNATYTGTWKAEAKTQNSMILTVNATTRSTFPSGATSVDTLNNSTLLNIVDRNTVATQDGSRSYRTAN